MPPAPTDIMLIIGGLATFASAVLRTDKLSALWNAILAGLFFVAIVAAYILLTTGFAGTLQGNTQYVVLAVVVVASTPQVMVLYTYFQTIPSPFDPKPTIPEQKASVRPMVTDWNNYPGSNTSGK